MQAIKKEEISKVLSEEGILSLLKKSLKYIRDKTFKITNVLIFELDLKDPFPRVDTGLKLSFRLASTRDIDSIDGEHYGYSPESKQYSKDRLSKGDKCVLALHNDKIVGYLWLMKNHMELSQFNHVPLPKHKAYTYNGFVIKEYRGKKIHAAMYSYIVDMLRKDGKRFVVSAIDKDNKPGLKTKLKNRGEYKIIGSILQLRFLGLKYDYIGKKDLKYLQSPNLSNPVLKSSK